MFVTRLNIFFFSCRYQVLLQFEMPFSDVVIIIRFLCVFVCVLCRYICARCRDGYFTTIPFGSFYFTHLTSSFQLTKIEENSFLIRIQIQVMLSLAHSFTLSFQIHVENNGTQKFARVKTRVKSIFSCWSVCRHNIYNIQYLFCATFRTSLWTRKK